MNGPAEHQGVTGTEEPGALGQRRRRGVLPAPVVLGCSFAAGALPFDYLAARVVAHTDLRHYKEGTVSGSALVEVAGFPTLAVSGCFDLAKGAVGPALAGRRRPVLQALAAGAAVAGHNWSPLLGGAGGRGISPSLGAMLAVAPEGVVVLGLGLGVGRLARRSGIGTLLGALALFPVLARRGIPGVVLAGCMVGPMLVKRALGNDHRPPATWPGWRSRLLFDRDLGSGRASRGAR